MHPERKIHLIPLLMAHFRKFQETSLCGWINDTRSCVV